MMVSFANDDIREGDHCTGCGKDKMEPRQIHSGLGYQGGEHQVPKRTSKLSSFDRSGSSCM